MGRKFHYGRRMCTRHVTNRIGLSDGEVLSLNAEPAV
jgi:hypothetical protein